MESRLPSPEHVFVRQVTDRGAVNCAVHVHRHDFRPLGRFHRHFPQGSDIPIKTVSIPQAAHIFPDTRGLRWALQVGSLQGQDVRVYAQGPSTVAFAERQSSSAGDGNAFGARLTACGAYMVHVQLGAQALAGWPRVVHVAAGPSHPERWLSRTHSPIFVSCSQDLAWRCYRCRVWHTHDGLMCDATLQTYQDRHTHMRRIIQVARHGTSRQFVTKGELEAAEVGHQICNDARAGRR
jgi:hypothetical protein